MKYRFFFIFLFSLVLHAQQFRNINNTSDLGLYKNNNGVAVADYDRDGDLDLFIVSVYSNDDEDSWSRLLENTNNGNFIDVTENSEIFSSGLALFPHIIFKLKNSLILPEVLLTYL